MMHELGPILNRDIFLFNQKHLSISEKYYVADEQENPILFVERPRHVARNLGAALGGLVAGFVPLVIFWVIYLYFIGQNEALASLSCFMGFAVAIPVYFVVTIALAPKRHLTFYRDDSKQAVIFEVIQNKKLEYPYATYTVQDVEGHLLANLRKNHLYNLFRKRWDCFTPEQSLLSVIREDSLLRAILRRVLGTLFGALRTNFVIYDANQDKKLGEFNRRFTILDRYVLDMSSDATQVMDRRIALAIGVLLDTVERR